MEVFGLSRVFHENYSFEEVNDTNEFEALNWVEPLSGNEQRGINLVIAKKVGYTWVTRENSVNLFAMDLGSEVTREGKISSL